MTKNNCDLNQLDALLNNSLEDKYQSDLIKHLERCSCCAQALQLRAAGHEQWSEVREFLSASTRDETGKDSNAIANHELPYAIRQVLDQLSPSEDPRHLGRLDSYDVLGVIGQGAMGIVLKALDRPLDRIVALKVMSPALASCGTARQRFAREAKAAAGVLHPNVVAIFGVSTNHNIPYLAMPYVSGSSLQRRLDRHGPLNLVELLRVGNHIASGLAAAHQQGLIHRDIKPSNILLENGIETALITDFGLARTIDDATMTRTGAITGTPQYMSPEQARGESLDCSSDLFSLGSVLYTSATGHVPFAAKTPFGVLRKISDHSVRPIREINPDIPIWFCNVVERLHDKSPSKRPSAVEIRDFFAGAIAHVYQPTRIPLPKPPGEPTQLNIGGSISVTRLGIFAMLLAALFTACMILLTPADGPEIDGREQASRKRPEISDVARTLELTFPSPDQKGKLEIDINRGFIEVTGHDQPNVVIEILEPKNQFKKQPGESSLEPKFAPNYDLKRIDSENAIKLDTYNQDYALNLRIKVPFQTDLTLDTYYDGYIKIANIRGTIKATSQNCDISLTEILGAAICSGYNGDILVEFREITPDAKLDFESYNGDITVKLPSEISAITAVSAGAGVYFTEFDSTPASPTLVGKSGMFEQFVQDDEYEFATINGGDIPIRIEGAKGRIEIRKRND